MPYLGEIAATLTAVCWTGSSLWFALATRRAGGLAVNQFRLLLALPCLLLLHRLGEGAWWPLLPGQRAAQLVLSGLFGLVVGDLGYFYALGVIGPRVSAVLMATWPVLATAITWAWHGEAPSLPMAVGIAATIGGVMLVLLRGGEGARWPVQATRWQQRFAILGALWGALGQAGGAVLVAVATAPAPELPAGLPGLSAALVRMAAASAGIVAVAALQGRPLAALRVLDDRRALAASLGGTGLGPVAGVWLSMVALAHAPVGVAAALIATTPVFMLPVAKVAYGARIGVLGAVGTLLTVGGVALLLLCKA